MINLETEIIYGYEVTAKTKRIWAKELEMAKEFASVCEKYHLKYWIMGGTLLGAVRHKGFIPWDNDMDMAMPRKDFNKLLEIGPSVFKSPLFFQTPVTEHGRYFRTYVRIRNGNGTAAFREEYNQGINCGIFIDVFCLDEIPDSSWLRKFYFRRINEIAKMARFALGNRLKVGWRNSIKQSVQRFIYKVILRSPDSATIFDFYQKAAGRYAGCGKKSLAHQAFGFHPNFIWNANDWENTIMLPFEDTWLCAPEGYDSILKHQFGNYMQVPADKSTHIYHSFDPDTPYTLFFAEESEGQSPK